MKKQRKQKATKKKSQTVRPETPSQPERRNVLRAVGYSVFGVGLLGGGGVFAYNSVRKTMAEFDLSQLGQGTPTIVQIHDPSCSLCQNLQRQTRKALRAFDSDEITYLVANITTQEGRLFAHQYGAQHVTLLLFNAKGELVSRIEGVQPKALLEDEFRAAFAL
ncbi:MAG: hypothetical protein AAGJ34_12205 [Pseudomonadota bacterium]